MIGSPSFFLLFTRAGSGWVRDLKADKIGQDPILTHLV